MPKSKELVSSSFLNSDSDSQVALEKPGKKQRTGETYSSGIFQVQQ
jgi:hypothetical protein